jgi:hypothetical protein
MSDQPGIIDVHDDAPEERSEPQPPKIQTQDKQPPVPYKALSAWGEYYDTLGVDRKVEVERQSKFYEYEVPLQPVYDEHDTTKLLIPDEIKVYKRRKISTRDYLETEQIRVQMRMSKSPKETFDLMVKLYSRMAWFYLEDKATGERMSKETWYRWDWVPMKNVLDGANLHSTMGKPPLEMSR